mmetsp:Transcript_5594/g.11496  ORF Transcript_5594/g.11496 Transcript_5594/m.11496 type:complete len:245 (+) Transcript_5594:1189-1923(+)
MINVATKEADFRFRGVGSRVQIHRRWRIRNTQIIRHRKDLFRTVHLLQTIDIALQVLGLTKRVATRAGWSQEPISLRRHLIANDAVKDEWRQSGAKWKTIHLAAFRDQHRTVASNVGTLKGSGCHLQARVGCNGFGNVKSLHLTGQDEHRRGKVSGIGKLLRSLSIHGCCGQGHGPRSIVRRHVTAGPRPDLNGMRRRGTVLVIIQARDFNRFAAQVANVKETPPTNVAAVNGGHHHLFVGPAR